MALRAVSKKGIGCRLFSTNLSRPEIRTLDHLPPKITPRYLGMINKKLEPPNKELSRNTENQGNDVLSLQWPAPPRNILMIKKDGAPAVTESLVEYAKYDNSRYPPSCFSLLNQTQIYTLEL